MTLAAFATVAAIHLLAAISPGPAFVLSVRTAASQGARPASWLALGFGIGAALWAAAALAGMAVLFEALPGLFVAVKLAGGLFLLWIALGLWRHAGEPMPAPDAAVPRGRRASLRLGLVAQLANPKPAMFFGAVFLGLVPAAATAGDKAIVVGNILWMETAWYLVVARLFSAGRARRLYARAKGWLDRIMAATLGALAARIAMG